MIRLFIVGVTLAVFATGCAAEGSEPEESPAPAATEAPAILELPSPAGDSHPTMIWQRGADRSNVIDCRACTPGQCYAKMNGLDPAC